MESTTHVVARGPTPTVDVRRVQNWWIKEKSDYQLYLKTKGSVDGLFIVRKIPASTLTQECKDVWMQVYRETGEQFSVYEVERSYLAEHLRGQGIGWDLYKLAVKYAWDRGGMLLADDCKRGGKTSPDALRVWNKLKAKYYHPGANVIMYQRPTAMRMVARRLAMTMRLASLAQLQELVDQLLPGTIIARDRLVGPRLTPQLVLRVEAPPVKGKIGGHEGPKPGRPFSVLRIAPRAFDNPSYLRIVVQHELIHFVLQANNDPNPHDGAFTVLAEALGIPKKYQD